MAIAYSRLIPVFKTKNIRIAKIAWVLFGSLMMIKWFIYINLQNDLQLLINIPFLEPVRLLLLNSQPYEYLETISLLVLMILIALYPETLLISEYQILEAKKLYNLIEKEEDKKWNFQIKNTIKNLNDYIKEIPQVLIDAIKGQKTKIQ